MNKRLILVSSTETKDYIKLYGIGLDPSSIIVLARREEKKPETAEPVNPNDVGLLSSLGDEDGVMIMDSDSFKYLQKFYHFGIRSENFFDCSKLKRLSIEGGAFVKCIYEKIPDIDEIHYFLSSEFSKPRIFNNFKQKILHTVPECIRMIDYFDSLPDDTYYGFDYEASGMPLDIQFEISGASLCTEQFGGFISFTDCRHNNPEEYYKLLDRLGNFLEKRQDHIWVYNMQYEFQVSHRMLGVTLYNLCDASTINVLDGNHLKKYSLKWTAQYILGVTVWDTEFDRISELVDSMLFETIGKLKKDKKKILKVTPETFKTTPEWEELCKRYPNYIKEFEQLILEYWGNPFMCIPSDILGHYCNLDAFHTLLLFLTRKNEYSEDAWHAHLDNTRMGSLLHSSGLYIDENFRMQYHNESLKMMAWGITYCAEARCKIKMNKHKTKMANIKKYNKICQKLIKSGNFYNGDPLEITKYLLSSNIDSFDVSETGLNEGQLLMSYGSDFSETFIDIVSESMKEAKMKEKINEGIVRKKKVLGIIAGKLIYLLELDKIDLGIKHQELEKYIYYENAYNELIKISKKQLNDINNIPEEIYAFGRKMNLQEYSDYISEFYFKCKSPIENDEICFEFADLYKSESTYLAAIFESTQQLNGAEHFYDNLGITTIEDAFEHFMTNWKNYVISRRNVEQYYIDLGFSPDKKHTAEEKFEEFYQNGSISPDEYNTIKSKEPETVLGDYPEKIYKLSGEFYGAITKNKGLTNQLKEVWSNFNGYVAQEQFFKYVSDQFLDYGKPFEETDLNNNFFFMRKLVVNYLLYKKYSKVLSTYIDGMFKANNRWVIEGPDRIPLRYADPDESGAVEKCFVHYEVNTKSSKRWSSGFHTIISHADLKDCIAVPPSYDENGNIIYGGSNMFLTYFDISSAEVKAATFASMDPDLIRTIEEGNDIYIFSARIYLGNKWDELDNKAKKVWRKKFKTVFLGV